MEEAEPRSHLTAEAPGADTEHVSADQAVEEDQGHEGRRANSDSGCSVELYRQMFTGDASNREFCFTQKCIPCHRCTGNMRLCMRKVRYRNIVKILECDTCEWMSVVNKALLLDKNYPTYRCTRKNCQTFCSPRTLTRRLRNVAYDRLRNRKVRAEISPQAKQQLLVAFGTCLAATSDGSPTSYSTERAKLARDKLALRAVSEATVLLRAMLADDSCTVSSPLKTAIRDLSSVLPCFSNIPITGSELQKSKLKKRIYDAGLKKPTVPNAPNKDTTDVQESPSGSASAMSDELSATMDTDLEGATSPDWSASRDERSDSASPMSDVDAASVMGCRKLSTPRLSARPWVKVSKFSSSFAVTVVQNAGWETVDTSECAEASDNKQMVCSTCAITKSATRTVLKYANESGQAVDDDINIANESRAREVFSAIAL